MVKELAEEQLSNRNNVVEAVNSMQTTIVEKWKNTRNNGSAARAIQNAKMRNSITRSYLDQNSLDGYVSVMI